MATTTITANRQAYASSGGKSAWSTARNASEASDFVNYTGGAVDNTTAIREFSQVSIQPETYGVNRTFLSFDLSGINGTITAITLKVYGVTNASIDVTPVKSTAFGGDGTTAFVATDFNNWSPSSPTTYTSTAGQAWSIDQNNTFNLNSTARSDANTDGYLNLVLVGSRNDYPDTTPTVNLDRKGGARFNSTAAPITLDITYTPTGYGNDVNGVASANIVNVNGVATANIANINGVS